MDSAGGWTPDVAGAAEAIRDMAVQPPELEIPTLASARAALSTQQVFDGTVLSVSSDEFVALLRDRSNPNNPDEVVTFDVDSVPEADMPVLQEGAGLYWIIGKEKTRGGTIKNVSVIQMKRRPRWTRASLKISPNSRFMRFALQAE